MFADSSEGGGVLRLQFPRSDDAHILTQKRMFLRRGEWGVLRLSAEVIYYLTQENDKKTELFDGGGSKIAI